MAKTLKVDGVYTVEATGGISFSDDVTINGDFNVIGASTVVTTTNTSIQDNIIVLNNGESGAGITEGSAGIEIDRGSLTNVQIRYNETTDKWQLTNDGSSFNEIVTTATSGTFLTEVSDDTSPQLGGDLDVNGQSIVSVSNVNITITPDGTGDVVVGNGDLLPSGSSTIQSLGSSTDYWTNLYVYDIKSDEISGTIQTASQPNLTSLGTLTGLDITGTLTTTGQADIDNIRINGNTISATTGAITLTPAAGSAVNLDDSNISADGGIFTVSGQVNVDNLTLNGNSITTTDTNGNLFLDPDGTGYVQIVGTNAVLVPVGTTGERPGTASNGMFRFNTTTSNLEYYDGSWQSITGVSTNIIQQNNSNITITDSGTGQASVNIDGSEQARFTSTASAVNYLTFTGGTTGNAVSIGAAGETNIDIDITATGTGVVSIGSNVNIAASSSLQFNGTSILTDSTGTMTLSNIDAIDATTETTLEAVIDSLANLTTVGTITTGTWNADVVGVQYGGTGLATVGTNQILTGNGTSALTSESTLIYDGSALYINDSTNANSTIGLTINQGANDNEIFALKSSDITHGFTTKTETDTFFTIAKNSATLGGTRIRSIAEDAATSSVYVFESFGGTPETTKLTTSRSLIEFVASQHDGANTEEDLDDGANIFSVRGRVGGSTLARFIIDENGDTWQAGIQEFAGTNPEILGNDVDGTLTISSGNAANDSANIVLYGDTHATQASDIVFRNGASDVYQYDASATEHIYAGDIRLNDGDVLPSATSIIQNIGSPTDYWTNVYAYQLHGTATSAQYADLAENYLADQDYEVGTVLVFGGTKEVMEAKDSHDPRIAGVVSGKPAHLMNSDLKGKYVACVALQGRVPVKVEGRIKKGDMLVSAGNGKARAEKNPVMGSVIGKALENHSTGGPGMIEVVVGRL